MTRLLLALLLPACTPREPAPPAPDGDDPEDEEDTGPACAEGEVADGSRCLPEACGTGRWGDLDTGDVAFVDAGADEGGDGSHDAPHLRIGDALDAGSLRIAVAEGSYTETLELGSAHAGLELAGRCAALVTVDGSSGGDDAPVVLFDGDADTEIALSGLRLQGGRFAALYVEKGTARLSDAEVADNDSGGVVADGRRSTVRLDRVAISGSYSSRWSTVTSLYALNGGTLRATDTTVTGGQGGAVRADPDSSVELEDVEVTDGGSADGDHVATTLLAYDGGGIVADGLVLRDVLDRAVYALGDGASIHLADFEIDGVSASEPSEFGAGLYVGSGGSVTAVGGRIAGTAGFGAYVAGATLVLEDVVLEDLALFPDDAPGFAVSASDGATVTAKGLTIGGYAGAGIVAFDRGTTVSVEDTVVAGLDVLDAEPTGALAFGSGASASLARVEISDVAGFGIVATESGTRVTGTDVVILDLHPPVQGSAAAGLSVGEGAEIGLAGLTLAGVEGVGAFASGEGAWLELTGGTLDAVSAVLYPDSSFEEGAGVLAQGGATAVLTDVTIGGVEGVGVQAAGAGSFVSLEEVGVQGTIAPSDGLFFRDLDVFEGGTMEARGVRVGGGEGAGVVVHDATFVFEDLVVADPGLRGMQVQAGGVASGSGLRVSGARTIGVAVDGGTLDLADGEVSGTRAGDEARTSVGLVVEREGAATLEGFVADANEGPGIALLGGTLACVGCDLADNRFAGLVALAGSVSLEAGTLSGTVADAGTEGGFGLFADGREEAVELVLDGVTIEGNAIGGVWLDQVLAARFVGSSLGGSAQVELYRGVYAQGDAVYAAGVGAWDGAAGLLLDACTLRDAAGAGLFLDGASASLTDVAWEANVTDVVLQRCSHPAAATPTGIESAGTSELCPTYDTIVGTYRFDFDAPPLVTLEE